MVKKLEDLIESEVLSTNGQVDDDKLEQFSDILQQVKLDGDLDQKNLLTGFKILRQVALKIYEENKLSLELFQKENEEASKRGFLFIY